MKSKGKGKGVRLFTVTPAHYYHVQLAELSTTGCQGNGVNANTTWIVMSGAGNTAGQLVFKADICRHG
jgi:hypothetical protein